MTISKSQIKRLEIVVKNSVKQHNLQYYISPLPPDYIGYMIDVVENDKVIDQISPDSAEGRQLLREDKVIYPKINLDL